MTGAELLTYVQRRLAEAGLDVPAERTAELYDYITEGRDTLLQAFALTAPVVVKAVVTLEQVGATQVWQFPAATKDPYRVLQVYDSETLEPLDPSAKLDNDAGHYAWVTLRSLRLAQDVALEGAPAVDAVLHGGAIVAGTAEAAIGLPTTCHRAIGKLAAVLALTADEESDARTAAGLFQREIDQLERIYGDYDANGGLALRHALMAAIGAAHGDTLY